MKTERLVTDDAAVELEARLFEALARAGMAAVEYGHVVFAGDGVDGVEQREEVFLGVDVFLAVGAKQYVPAFLEAETGVDVAGFDCGKVFVEHFGHWRAGDIGAFFGESAVGEVTPGVLAVA